MSFNVRGPWIMDNGVGTPASPGAYFGFGQTNLMSSDSSGPRIYAGLGNPNGVTTAPIGSMWFETATGGWYRNVNGTTGWVLMVGGGSGTPTTIFDSGFIAAPTAAMNTGTLVYDAGVVNLSYLLLSRLSDVATYQRILGRLNGDSVAANYISLRSLGDPAVGVLTAPKDVNAASRIIGSAPASTSTAGKFGILTGWVPFFLGTQLKLMTGNSKDFRSLAGEEFPSDGAIEWNNTAAVTSMGFTDAGGGNFEIGSRLIVYAQ